MSRLQDVDLLEPGQADYVLPGSNGGAIVVPDAHLLFSGHFKRVGPDLIIEGEGRRALLPDYFAREHGAELQSPDGARLGPETIRGLAGQDSPWQVAQAGGGAVPAEIGTVRTLSGTASVLRGGSTQPLATGERIFQGDVVETGAGSALGIILKDNTVFSLSASARMLMNELVYDPARSDNSMSISLVQGTFVFVTGQVAKSGSVAITTPVATMGIRGTTPIVKLFAFDGSGEFSIAADPLPGAPVGSYTLTLPSGQQTSVASTDVVVRITGAAAFQLLSKSATDQQSDQQIIAPAYQLYSLIGQRTDIPSPNQQANATGKGQGTGGFEYAFAIFGLSELQGTPLLENTRFEQEIGYGLGGTSPYDDVLRRGIAGGGFTVDLDTTSPGVNRFAQYVENGGGLPVTSAAQITLPAGIGLISSATVVLQNQLPGDVMLIGALPPGISVTITFGSIHVNLSGTATAADYIAAIEAIRFANTTDNPSTDVRVIDVTVTAVNGATATATTFVTIDAVNDAPVNHLPGEQHTAEDSSLVFSTAHCNSITVSDADAGTQPITTTLTVAHGTLTIAADVIGSTGVSVTGNGTGTLVVTGSQTAINAALDGLAYRGLPDFTGSDSIVVSTTDHGASGSGGPLTTTSHGLDIEVASVNDAPVVSGPGGSLPVTGLSVEGISGLSHTSFVPSEVAPGVYQLTAASEQQAGAVWQPIDLSHAFTVTSRVYLGDNTDGADGIAFTIQSQGTTALTYLSNSGGYHVGGNLGVGGFPDGGLHSAFGVWIDTYDNGVPVEPSDPFPRGNSIAFFENDAAGGTNLPGGATAMPLTGVLENGQWHDLTIAWDGISTLSFTLVLHDADGAVLETITSSQTFDPLQLPAGQVFLGFAGATGAAFNDQFVEIDSISAGYATGEQSVLHLTGTGLTISDVDAGNNPLVVTLSVGEGTLHAVAGATGIEIIGGNDTSVLVVSGSLEQLNGFLAGGMGAVLNYLNGSDTPAIATSLTLSVDDQGASGAGGPQTGVFTTSIAITPINDAPTLTTPDGCEPQSVEDYYSPLTFSSANGNAITMFDADAGNGIVTATLHVDNGDLSLGSTQGIYFLPSGEGNGQWEGEGEGQYGYTLTIAGTQAAINTALEGLTYRPYDNGSDRLTITVTDNGASGARGAMTATASIDIIIGGHEHSSGARVLPDAKLAASADVIAFSALGSAIEIGDAPTASDMSGMDAKLSIALEPGEAAAILDHFNTSTQQIDLSGLLTDAARAGTVNAGNIGEYVQAIDKGDGSIEVLVDADGSHGPDTSVRVATMTGAASSGEHVLGSSASDVIAVVFDQSQAAAHVGISHGA